MNPYRVPIELEDKLKNYNQILFPYSMLKKEIIT